MIIKNTLAKVQRQKIHRYIGYTGKSVTMEGFPAAKLQRHFWFDGKWCNGKRYNGKITAAFSTQSCQKGRSQSSIGSTQEYILTKDYNIKAQR